MPPPTPASARTTRSSSAATASTRSGSASSTRGSSPIAAAGRRSGLRPRLPGEHRPHRANARQERIFSLLDFHQDLYNERFEGEGWPDWQTLDDGQPAEPKNGFPANYLLMPALNSAFDHFWANDPGRRRRSAGPLRRRLAHRGRAVPGERLRDRLRPPQRAVARNRLAELCLIPPAAPPSTPPSSPRSTDRVIAAIREVDRETLVFYEPLLTFNFGAATGHADTGDESAGFSFHDYCLPAGLGIPIPAGLACATLEELVFQNAAGVTERTGDVSFLTEFGATDDARDERAAASASPTSTWSRGRPGTTATATTRRPRDPASRRPSIDPPQAAEGRQRQVGKAGDLLAPLPAGRRRDARELLLRPRKPRVRAGLYDRTRRWRQAPRQGGAPRSSSRRSITTATTRSRPMEPRSSRSRSGASCDFATTGAPERSP